jgi:hypothetical protein
LNIGITILVIMTTSKTEDFFINSNDSWADIEDDEHVLKAQVDRQKEQIKKLEEREKILTTEILKLKSTSTDDRVTKALAEAEKALDNIRKIVGVPLKQVETKQPEITILKRETKEVDIVPAKTYAMALADSDFKPVKSKKTKQKETHEFISYDEEQEIGIEHFPLEDAKHESCRFLYRNVEGYHPKQMDEKPLAIACNKGHCTIVSHRDFRPEGYCMRMQYFSDIGEEPKVLTICARPCIGTFKYCTKCKDYIRNKNNARMNQN